LYVHRGEAKIGSQFQNLLWTVTLYDSSQQFAFMLPSRRGLDDLTNGFPDNGLRFAIIPGTKILDFNDAFAFEQLPSQGLDAISGKTSLLWQDIRHKVKNEWRMHAMLGFGLPPMLAKLNDLVHAQ
jgi:hypothetical protein